MTSIKALWPFYQWGMDILGPLPPARGGAKFVIVAIDYFTKWIEAKPLVRIIGKEVIRFVMDNIICRFGLPRIIVTDNRAQLVNVLLKAHVNRFELHQIELRYRGASQSNYTAGRKGQIGVDGRGYHLLGRERAGWVDELPNVLKEEKQLLLGKRNTKQRWNNTITRRFACQGSGLEKLCSEEMKRAG
ncbi:reverse transcriptase domain-containing protein [Tanacetum coccineum]